MTPDKDILINIGSIFRKKLEVYMADRYLLEQQWLRNLRQTTATYDPDIKQRIPLDKSSAYPRNTRKKIKDFVATMMEMMFPAKERNWELAVSPNPSIPQDALADILARLEAAATEEGSAVTSDAIERAVKEYANAKKDKMQQEIDDQISDAGVDYPGMCKKAVRSGAVFGCGIVRSPMVRTQEERYWEMDPATGRWEARKRTVRRPYPEGIRIWDFYPDLSAKSWEQQDLVFERYILKRNDLKDLAKRGDFFGQAIRDYLKEKPSGNYQPQPFETELRDIAKTANIDSLETRNYEVYRGLGFVSAHELAQLGVDIPEDKLHEDFFADIWFTDNIIIKAKKAAFGDRPADQYHRFIYTEDEDAGITGIGMPEDVRDSQMALCASTRALFDNMATSAGPVFEVNEELIAHGRPKPTRIQAFDVIYRNSGIGTDAQYPAVRSIESKSHIPEILSVIQDQRQQLDLESNLPSFVTGNLNEPLGEAFRTSSNMSMMRGGAHMVTKDVVRSFDRLTTGVIGSLLRWNMEFGEKEDIKGDFNVRAKGSDSLVAKEVRGAALDQFVTTLTPEDRAVLDMYGIMIDRLKARDLPTDRVLPRDEAMRVLEGMRQAASQAAAVEQGLTTARTESYKADAQKKTTEAQISAATIEAVISEILSRVSMNAATARESENRVQIENLHTLLSAAMEKKQDEQGQRTGTEASAPRA